VPAGSGGHLADRLAVLQRRVEQVVEIRRADDPAPDDPFRGLYVSDEVADGLLPPRQDVPVPPALAQERAAAELAEDDRERAGTPSRLRRLARAARLRDLDVDLLVAALAPDVDPRLERLYGYLNDDVSRRRASIGLALELAGVPVADARARARLAPGAPLVDLGLVVVEDGDRPFLTRGLRVPDRVVAHLLGDDTPEPGLAEVVTTAVAYPGPDADRLARALDSGVPLVYLRERGRRTGAAVAAAAVLATGREVLALDLDRLVGAEADAGADIVRQAGREALLRGAGIVARPVASAREETAARQVGALRRLAALSASGVPVLLAGDGTWDPTWTSHPPLQLDAPLLGHQERTALWAGHVGVDVTQAPTHLPLGPGDIARAVDAARLQALADPDAVGDRGLDGAALRRGARAQNAAGLERLARRLEPDVGWKDLVLPASVSGALHELAARARHRDTVLTDWRMRPGGGRGHGVTALFAGDSGTGKTMAAEVIAAELGLDLYTVDLATVVDKYVGETEKNLERIFTEAGGVNAVLLFDEADAVFGKRSEVRDAHDRYANVESAYLLQRMETFDGLAILATNLRANIDEAFTRRLDAIVDFPTPDAELRLALWDRCLGAHLPRGSDLDLAFCARSFELSGGAIRSVAVTAAYLAAERGVPVGMAELIAAVQREYRKQGRLVLDREFGRYLSSVR
jgi:hypothetical protein